MRKTTTILGAAALLAASSFAVLADEANGSITSIDTAAMTVTLDNGSTYKLDPALNPASLKVGQSVKIEFTTNTDGSLSATAVGPGPS